MTPPARKLPASVPTECALLGALLFDGQLVRRLDGLLQPVDFYDGKHPPIFAAMREIDRRGDRVDLVTVADQLTRDGTLSYLKAFGSEAYLVDLANEARGFEPVESYAKILRRHADRRRLILLTATWAEQSYSDESEFDAVYEQASRELLELGRRTGGAPAEPVQRLLAQVFRDLEARYHAKQAITGVTSGFHELDEMTAGFQPCDLVLVAGRPSMGKTAFALQCALNATEKPKPVPVLIFSLEMDKASLTERLLSSMGRVDSSRLRNGMLQSLDWARLQRGGAELYQRRIEIDDTGALTVPEIRARARYWRSKRDLFPEGQGPGLIVLDYIQLCDGSPHGREQNRAQEVAEISKGLKNLAKELRVPVVALSQLNRGVDGRADKRPTMADLRDSGALEQDADVVLFLYRDEYYNRDSDDKGVAEVIVSKQRRGPTGIVKLHFDGACTRFESLTERSAA